MPKLCAHCGEELDSTVCFHCGMNQIKGVPPIEKPKFPPPEPPTPPEHIDPSTLIISGDGSESAAVSTVWLWTIIELLLTVGGGYGLAWLFQTPSFDWRTGVWTREFGAFSITILFIYGAFALFVLFAGSLLSSRITQTRLDIDQERIRGTVVDAGISIPLIIFFTTSIFAFIFWPKSRHAHIDLTFDQISSVEATDDSVILTAPGARYKCYASNSAELQRIINEQMRLAAQK